MKQFILYILLINSAYSQNGRIFETYKTDSDSTDQSHGTIFTKPFQEYNYIKTHRGIELYRTYKTKLDSTNQSDGTVFSTPFPEFIIINDKVYRTYKTKLDSTNQSHGTVFTKPFESKQIFNKTTTTTTTKTSLNTKIVYQFKYKEALPKYNGEGDITYGE